MLRAVLAAFAALVMSACSYGSAVDMAPFKERLDKPAVAPGDYCEVKGEAAPFTVVSHEDCVPVTWDQATRIHTMIDTEKQDGKDESIHAAIVSLGSGLYIAQIDAKDEDRNAPDRYQLQILLARGNAFAVLPALDDEPLKALVKRHRNVSFKNDSAGRPYIAAGPPDRIRAFLRDAAKESLRLMSEKKDDEKDALSVGVLDAAGAADHPASEQQTRDIEAVLNIAKSITPR